MVNLVAEIGINHNGSVDVATNLVLAAAEAGFHAVKFQKRTVEAVYTAEELDSPRESPWGSTTREQKEGLELTADDFLTLFLQARSLQLKFGVSCWDPASVEWMEAAIPVDFYKIASPMVTNRPLLDAVASTGRFCIVSTGMSTREQVEAAVAVLPATRFVLACTSAYPTPDEHVNLRSIGSLQEWFPALSVGFSNHSPDPLASWGAVAAGADLIETHITLDRTMYGSDQSASIENLKEFADGCQRMEMMRGEGGKVIFPSEHSAMHKLRRDQ